MSQSKKRVIQGTGSNNEVDHNKSFRDTRTGRQKFEEFMMNDGSFVVAIMFLVVVSMDVLLSFTKGKATGYSLYLLLFLPFLNKASSRLYVLPFKKPKSSGELDVNQAHPVDGSPTKALGISFYGNDSTSDEQIWFASDDVRVHCLIFGTTGAGKTETLLSICMNSLIHASGFIYVDGKGDNSLFLKVFSMVRRMGREDDLLLINYMTGTFDPTKKTFSKLSNTMNAFSNGSDSSLSELISSLLPGGGDGMWKGRAAVFIAALMTPLVYLRNERKIMLDINVIRKHFSLEKLEELIARDDIPLNKKDGLQDYVWNIPGYAKADPEKPDEDIQQEYGVFEQHGFIVMQYTEVFGMLSDTYGHIMKTQLAEVDFFDVVVNRRFLVVLLPALEKSPQSLGNLGKIIVSSVKSMMVSGLGSLVEGHKRDVIESKPTNAPAPYVTVFDEYGYYAVEGSAVMPAQARSLGFSMIFAGQDYQAFKKGSADEAASIVANCGLKICMKLEDPTETLEIFTKAAGQANVAISGGMQINKESTMGGYADTGNVNHSTKERINVRDLKDQGAGEAHILFADTFVRAKMFYANPTQVNEIRLNKFLKVPMPNYNKIKKLTLGYNKISRAFKSFTSEEAAERKESIKLFIDEHNSEDLKSVIDIFKNTEGLGSMQSRAVLALYSNIKKQKQTDYQLEEDTEAIERLSTVEHEFQDESDEYSDINIDSHDENNDFAAEPDFEDEVDDSTVVEIRKELKPRASKRDDIAKSYKSATNNRKITGKQKTGTDKLREILQKSHMKSEGNHNKYNPYNEMKIDAPELQNEMQNLERKLTESYNDKGLLDDDMRMDEGFSEMATEKVINDIGLKTSYYNEVKIQKRDQNKKLIKGIIDDIILTDVE